ncbi:hypothetical protein OESDEN_17135 [Oesophagostomum dentatum]|uniref:CHMP7 winged helix domain-containing protein n=1 Tax=Oesophagostomum dentatum TaxID=61180 RepID=A0A0B1SD22_OESDE|nr:hypothetical protein OESDEN_17135 [Oesophagostomum dentatum]
MVSYVFQIVYLFLPTKVAFFSRGDLIPLSKWKEQHSSWIDWSFCQLSKTSEWLFGSAKSDVSARYIHLPTIKVQADSLMNLYSREFQSEVDGTGSIVAYSTFYDNASDIVHTKENFDVALAYLSERGDVVIGQDRHGEKILKFRVSFAVHVRFRSTTKLLFNIYVTFLQLFAYITCMVCTSRKFVLVQHFERLSIAAFYRINAMSSAKHWHA